MLTKRIIACLDVLNGNVTKATKFQNNILVGTAEKVTADLYLAGIDEVIFFDIMASAERRKVDLDTVRAVAKSIFVPFTVGGGLRSLDDMRDTLRSGAEKVSLDSMAVRNPAIIRQGAEAFGSQCIVVSIQIRKVQITDEIPSGYEVAIDGARVFTGKDAVIWAQEAVSLGAGELCINSIDQDGTHLGYDIGILNRICNAVDVPVIASGGAGTLEHVSTLFSTTEASAAIVSSMLYSPRLLRNYSVAEIKSHLSDCNIVVRPSAINFTQE